MAGTTAVGAGLLRPRPVEEDDRVDVGRHASRLRRRIRAELAGRLAEVVPTGWEVMTAPAWRPGGPGEPALHPDVLVHPALDRAGRLPASPVLCVVVEAGPADRRSTQVYARHGVDHHWHLDTCGGELQVSVRVGDEYRRAETLITGGPSGGSPPLDPEWTDFGIGLLRLDPILGHGWGADERR